MVNTHFKQVKFIIFFKRGIRLISDKSYRNYLHVSLCLYAQIIAAVLERIPDALQAEKLVCCYFLSVIRAAFIPSHGRVKKLSLPFKLEVPVHVSQRGGFVISML